MKTINYYKKHPEYLNISYDDEYDTLLIYLNQDYTYLQSKELTNNIIMDIDVNKKPVAFEFLNASDIYSLKDTEITPEIMNIFLDKILEIRKEVLELWN